jgi:hypothetical protein
MKARPGFEKVEIISPLPMVFMDQARPDGISLDLVKDLMGEGLMHLSFAASGAAKSATAIDVGLHIALNRPWRGRAVMQGLVVYVAAEAPKSVEARACAWMQHHHVTDRGKVPFVIIKTPVMLPDADARERLIQAVRIAEAHFDMKCMLVIFDTLSACFGVGSEIEDDKARAFVNAEKEIVAKLKCATWVLHHKPRNGNNPRGSTVLEAEHEVRFEHEKNGNVFSFRVAHMKDGEPGAEVLSAVHGVEMVGENDKIVSAPVIVPIEIRPDGEPGRPKAEEKLTGRQLRVMQELWRQARERRSWDFTFDEFSEACRRSGACSGCSESRARALPAELRLQLANKGEISVEGDTLRLKRGG